ncbi:hypothetical protein LWI29_007354 [Acer saccharum]|uniref:Uncharacterized protein n=1 Tax=Acer saccharum TaxID=4024 RepID=A0AA39W902_ACESA|nr:hypothetical protein LWI29_007354 [Acer saccharum]
MKISKETTDSSFSNKSIDSGVDVRKECRNCFSKLSMVNKVGEWGEGTENDILKPTKANGGASSNVGYVGESENRDEREKCDLVGTRDLGSLGSFESISSKRRSVRVFGSKDGSCGGVGVSYNQVIYINFKEGKDLNKGNFGDPVIDLFVDLGGLHFGRKGNMEDSVDSLCSSVARRSNKNFFPSRSHQMKTSSGARGIDFNAVDDVMMDQCVSGKNVAKRLISSCFVYGVFRA